MMFSSFICEFSQDLWILDLNSFLEAHIQVNIAVNIMVLKIFYGWPSSSKAVLALHLE